MTTQRSIVMLASVPSEIKDAAIANHLEAPVRRLLADCGGVIDSHSIETVDNPATTPSPAEIALSNLVAAISATGGVYRCNDGLEHPVEAPHWTDLGKAYVEACEVLGIEPVVEAAADEDDTFDVELEQETVARVARVQARNQFILGVRDTVTGIEAQNEAIRQYDKDNPL